VARTGRLYGDSGPSLTPFTGTAQNLPSLKNVQMRKQGGRTEAAPKCVWSDGTAHLDEQWPAHAVPLFLFSGPDRPRPAYREEVRFTLRDEKYVNFGLRLKCGTGDRYMGGSVGLVHSADSSEALPGTQGQLAMITDIIVNPDNSVVVSVVGDLNFRVLQSWMPRGLRGMQLAFIDVEPPSVPIHQPIIETCAREPDLRTFARLASAVESVVQTLAGGGPFTAFLPTDAALRRTLGQDEEQLLARPDLEALLRSHICFDRAVFDAMYAGRVFRALDGSTLVVTFTTWPKHGPRVNDVPIEKMDIQCSNGVIHTIVSPLLPGHQRSR